MSKITASQLINGLVKARQGNTIGDGAWSIPGTSNTDTLTKNISIQVGAVTATGATDKVVTFPYAFTQTPIVVASAGSAGTANTWVEMVSVTTSTATFRNMSTAGTSSETINWIAIGV